MTPGVALDVGCSMGIVLDQLRRRGWTPCGVDVSAYATEYARREMGLDVVTGTIEQLQRPPESVDLVTMLLTIEHLPDPKGVLQAAHRLLRPGGVLIIATHDVEGLWPRVVGARWRHFNVPEHVYYFSRRTLTRLLSDVGFETFKVAETPTLAAVTESDDTETGLYAPIRFLHKTRLLSPAAPALRALHGSRARFLHKTRLLSPGSGRLDLSGWDHDVRAEGVSWCGWPNGTCRATPRPLPSRRTRRGLPAEDVVRYRTE